MDPFHEAPVLALGTGSRPWVRKACRPWSLSPEKCSNTTDPRRQWPRSQRTGSCAAQGPGNLDVFRLRFQHASNIRRGSRRRNEEGPFLLYADQRPAGTRGSAGSHASGCLVNSSGFRHFRSLHAETCRNLQAWECLQLKGRWFDGGSGKHSRSLPQLKLDGRRGDSGTHEGLSDVLMEMLASLACRTCRMYQDLLQACCPAVSLRPQLCKAERCKHLHCSQHRTAAVPPELASRWRRLLLPLGVGSSSGRAWQSVGLAVHAVKLSGSKASAKLSRASSVRT